MAASMNQTMLGGRLCCLCLSRTYICRKIIRRSLKFSAVQEAYKKDVSEPKPSLDLQLDVDVQQKLHRSGLKHRLHPGVLKVKAVTLPEPLLEAVQVLLEKYPFDQLSTNAEKFSRYLKCRHAPLEAQELRDRAVKIEEHVRQKEVGDKSIGDLNPEENQLLESKVKGKTLLQLKKQVYHWKKIEYTAYRGFLYMVGKMDHDYAALLRCLNEIRSRIPEFTPRSVFDYGSGVGSVIWGVNSVWKRAVQEYYCVDKSGEMNTLARLLLQDGEENKQMRVSGVYFRQFHPSIKHRFDLTVSTFSLFEFPSKSERLAAVKNLWDMTGEFMILVENGSIAGFRLIQEAREYVLGLGDSSDGHVFAPCPHDSKCPKLSWMKSSACNFEVTYRRLQLSSNTTVNDKARFCYVILRKGPRQTEAATYMWPRLVKRSSKPRNHTPCTLCCPDGTVKSVVITASKHSKDLYKCSRYCHLGDLLPVKMSQQKEEGHTEGIHDNTNAVDQSDDFDHSACDLYPQDSLSPS